MNANEIENAVDAYLREIGVTYAATLSEEGHDKGGWECDAWRTRFGGRKTALARPFYTGLGLRKRARPVAPPAAMVLDTLLRDTQAADMNFLDWSWEFGYDDDSRKAFDTYVQCCDIGRELRAVFTDTERAHLAELLKEY